MAIVREGHHEKSANYELAHSNAKLSIPADDGPAFDGEVSWCWLEAMGY
jgi:hypothetical protein